MRHICPRVSALVSVLLVSFAAACSTTSKGPVTDSLAAVEISGHKSLDIARAISQTFQEAGFTPVPVSPGPGINMVFEKMGTTKDAVVYGDWSLKRLWYRAKVRVDTKGPEGHLVRCDVYRIFNHGESHFEEEVKISTGKKTYQEMLEKAKARLEGANTH